MVRKMTKRKEWLSHVHGIAGRSAWLQWVHQSSRKWAQLAKSGPGGEQSQKQGIEMVQVSKWCKISIQQGL